MKKTLTILLTFMLSVCTVMAQTGEHERGLLSLKPSEHPFVQKGSWSIGGVYNLSALESSPSMFYMLKLKPEVSYAIANDMELGVRARYTRGLANVVETLGIENYRLLGHEYGGEFFARKYLTIGNSGRLAIYVDAALGAKAGQSIITKTEDSITSGSYKTNKALYLNVEPGLIVSVAPWLAISGGLSMASVGYSSSHQVHNQVDEGTRSGMEASYALNPLELSVASHFYLNNHRRYSSSSCMIKKGEVYGNMGVSFANGSSAGSQILLIANNLHGDGSIFSFTPELGYAYKDNASIGLRASMATGAVTLDNVGLEVPGMGISLELGDQAVNYTSYGLSVYHRNYKGLDSKGNFGVFFETSLGASKTSILLNDDSVLDQKSIKAVFSPGLMIYVLPFVSLEASAGIADLRWSPGSGDTFGGGLHFNLLNCRLGVSFHI